MELNKLLELESKRLFRKPIEELNNIETSLVYKYALDTLNRQNEEIASAVVNFTEMVEIAKDETKLLRSTKLYKQLLLTIK